MVHEESIDDLRAGSAGDAGGDPARHDRRCRRCTPAGHVLRSLARARSAADGVGRGARRWPLCSRTLASAWSNAQCSMPYAARSASRCIACCAATSSPWTSARSIPSWRQPLPASLCRREPLGACAVRHTVGLGDPLTAADVTPEERVDDGLPQDLESSIRAYGLRYFKIKLTGKGDVDLPRLERIVALLDREAGADWLVTLDGNENFRDFETFRAYWEAALAWPALRPLWPRVLVVEQPVHRDRALIDEVGPALRVWADRPRLIVDESDGAVGDVPRALALGYAGASHKNCKGIVKGLANAAVLHDRRRGRRRRRAHRRRSRQSWPCCAASGSRDDGAPRRHARRAQRPSLLSRPEHVSERLAARRRSTRTATSIGVTSRDFPRCGSSLDVSTWAPSTRRRSGWRRRSIRQCSSACPAEDPRLRH